jgi:ankyrin repeat protein
MIQNFINIQKKKLNRKLSKNGENIFLFASACGKIEVLKYLESLGFDINYKNKFGHNAYIYMHYILEK